MYFIQYAFMCFYIGTYLYFQSSNAPMPPLLPNVNSWVSWGFLLWGGFLAGRVIVDCILLQAKGQMTAGNFRNGFLLAVLNFLPVLAMSVFMLRQGFAHPQPAPL